MICSISLPMTILNRFIILNNNISTEEIKITCSSSGIFGLRGLHQVLIWGQRSLSYCTITDSIVRTDRHADVILTAYFGFQLLILTRCRTWSIKQPIRTQRFIRKPKLGSLQEQFEHVDDISPSVIICHSKHFKQL